LAALRRRTHVGADDAGSPKKTWKTKFSGFAQPMVKNTRHASRFSIASAVVRGGRAR
jgi:hypothetical protein